jgi:hypothetical protein
MNYSLAYIDRDFHSCLRQIEKKENSAGCLKGQGQNFLIAWKLTAVV